MDRLRLLILMLAGAAVLPAEAFADTAEHSHDASSLVYAPPRWPEPPDLGDLVLRLGLGTVVVLSVAGVVLWVGRHHLRGPSTQMPGNSGMHLVDTVTLSQHCRLSLLKAGNAQFLVALDGSGLKKMVALPETFEGTLGRLTNNE